MINRKVISVPRIFGGFSVAIIANIMFSFIFYRLIHTPTLNPLDIHVWKTGVTWILLTHLSLTYIIVLKLLVVDTRIVYINNGMISFIPWVLPILFKKRKMAYYDGYVLVKEFNPNGRDWEAIYLIKRGFFVSRISEFYYQNFQEIEDALAVPQLYYKKVSWLKQILVSAFGIPVPC